MFDRLAPMFADVGKDPGKEANVVSVDRGSLLAWMRDSVDRLMETLTSGSGKPRWGEKTPGHAFHVDLIHAVYPDAQFVHIIRHGQAVVRSLQNVSWSPRRIRWSVDRWRDSVTAARRSAVRLPSVQYVEIRYEALTRDPEAELRRLCHFLNEEYDVGLLEFHRPERNSWGMAQPPIKNGQLNDGYRALNLRERLVLHRRAGGLLRELGYA